MQEAFGLDGPVREQLTDEDLERIQRTSHPGFDYLKAGYPSERASDSWISYLKDIWPAWSTLTEHGAAELQRVTAPTLVVVGDRDPFQPLNEAVELYHHLPNAQLPSFLEWIMARRWAIAPTCSA